jgi:hypothetical protein
MIRGVFILPDEIDQKFQKSLFFQASPEIALFHQGFARRDIQDRSFASEIGTEDESPSPRHSISVFPRAPRSAGKGVSAIADREPISGALYKADSRVSAGR